MSNTYTYDRNARIVKLKLDIIFKRVFGTEEHTRWLAKFISRLLDIPFENIETIEILNTELVPEERDRKFSVLDLKARVNDEIVNIELQVHYQKDYSERTLYYWSRIYTENLKAKGRYGDTEKTVCVNILDFNYFDCDDYYSSYKIMEEKRHDILTEKFNICFFELRKLKKCRKNRPVEEWLDLINAETEGDLEMITSKTKDPDVKDIVVKIKQLSGDDAVRAQAEQREKEMFDQRSIIANAREDGYIEGEAKGIKEGQKKGEISGKISVIDKLLEMGFSLEQALQAGSMDRDTYEKYKNLK